MTIFPTNYQLSFEPDLAKFTFLGKEIISLVITKKVKTISLDSADLEISVCRLTQKGRGIAIKFRLDKVGQKLIITASHKLTPGKYTLTTDFSGILNDKLAGFYRSKYTIGKKVKYLATTQFEAADAKRAFPCFDEPAMKATFQVTLIADRTLQVVSNTLPRKTEILRSGKKMVTFETTPKMSTYLVYLGVGEFEWVEKKYKNILIRCLTTPGKKSGGKFALDVAAKCLKYYQSYFKMPYPLPKLDLLAIPDFSIGAMENWGAITFRESRLLFYPGKSSQSTKQGIAEVVAHEITHQWFGNLVTMKWWDDLWLNESFATFMAYKLTDRYWPEWDTFTRYVEDRTFDGMALDGLQNSHPISVKVDDVNKIDELFDAIAYSKGGSVLRMLEGYLGATDFRNGLRKYISKFKYGNAAAADLWSALESASDKPITRLTKKYILQTGYPVVSVQKKRRATSLSQSRFLFFQDPKDKSQWDIPLVVQSDRKKTDSYLLSSPSSSLPNRPGFLNLNANYTGFFISQYDSELLGSLGQNLNKINPRDRIGLIHDLFALVLSEKEVYSTFLTFTQKYFLTEKDPFVTAYLLGKLMGIRCSLGNSDRALDTFIRELSLSAIKRLGNKPRPSELPQVANLRATALTALIFLEEKSVLEFTLREFDGRSNKNIHPDIRRAVYLGALRKHPISYSKLLKIYREAETQEEKTRVLSVLASAKDPTLLQKTLTFTLSPQVRYANTIYVSRALAVNPQGKSLGIKWLLNKWNDLALSKTANTMVCRYHLEALVPETPPKLETEVGKFFAKNTPPTLRKTVREVLEQMRVNVRFTRKYGLL